MSLRVIHLVDSLGLGGAEVMLSQTLPVLAQRGVDVRVRAICHPDTLERSLAAAGVDVRTLTTRDHPSTLGDRAHYLGALLAELVRAPADVVHSHLFHPALVGRLAVLLRARRGPRLVTTLHNPDYSNMVGVPGWKRRARRAVDWATTLASTDALVAVSKGVRRDFEAHMGNTGVWGRIDVIRNAIDVEALASAIDGIDRAGARAELGIAPEDFAILAIGRVTHQKNLDLLVDVAGRLNDKGVRARVIVIGDGEDRARCVATSGPFVRYVGRLGRPGVERALSACDAYAQPSRWEAFGIAALEAMVAERPVVASAVPGLDEVVADGETGALVTPGDAEEMANAFARLARDRALAARWGTAGRKRARDRFGLGSWANDTLALYERLVASTRRLTSRIRGVRARFRGCLNRRCGPGGRPSNDIHPSSGARLRAPCVPDPRC